MPEIKPFLDEFEQVDLDTIGPSPNVGRPFDDLSRPKVCLHTTEGSTLEGARVAFHRTPPHLGVEFEGRKRRQYLPLDRSAFALLGSESDDEFVIQVEIVGFAKTAHEKSDEELDWLGAEVLAPIFRAGVEFELVGVPQGFHGEGEGMVLAVPDSPIRFANEAELRAFSGVMGHQHAPAPDEHWDPGRLNVDRILAACAAALGSSPPVVSGQGSAAEPLPFPLPPGHFFGPEAPEPENHSGFFPEDRPHIVALTSRMAALGLPVEVNERYTQALADVVAQFQADAEAAGADIGSTPTASGVDGLVGRLTWDLIFR